MFNLLLKNLKKATLNRQIDQQMLIAGMLILLFGAVFGLGFWLGGWREAWLLQSALESLPDINVCY